MKVKYELKEYWLEKGETLVMVGKHLLAHWKYDEENEKLLVLVLHFTEEINHYD